MSATCAECESNHRRTPAIDTDAGTTSRHWPTPLVNNPSQPRRSHTYPLLTYYIIAQKWQPRTAAWLRRWQRVWMSAVQTSSLAQLSQRDRAAGWVSYAKSGRLELGDNIYGHYKSIFNHCDVFGQQSNWIQWKTQNKAINYIYYAVQGRSRSVKVIEVGTNRKPVCDFLLVSNWQPISYRCGVIAAYCSNFGHFAFLSPPPLRGLRDNVRRSSWAHWKARSGLPVSVSWTFSLGVKAEALRANIGSKSAISLQRGPVDSNFPVEGVAPYQPFFFQKTIVNDLSYVIKIWTKFSSVLSQFRRLTDRQISSLDHFCILQRCNNGHCHCQCGHMIAILLPPHSTARKIFTVWKTQNFFPFQLIMPLLQSYRWSSNVCNLPFLLLLQVIGSKMQKGRYWFQIELRLKKVCYKVYFCENCSEKAVGHSLAN